MLDRSFIMLPRVGTRTEAKLWSNGILNWEDLTEADKISGISDMRLTQFKEIAREISELIERNRIRELAILLPPRQRWRLLGNWNAQFVALDLEASFVDNRWRPAVLTLKRGHESPRTLVRGDDLCWRSFDHHLKGATFIVTFNGSSFDIPFLKKHGFEVGKFIHLDLHNFSIMSGLSGGLKEIERKLGIRRSRELEFTTSEQVIYLWKCWEDKGKKRALDLLIDYNRRDTETLPYLAREIYERLVKRSNDVVKNSDHI